MLMQLYRYENGVILSAGIVLIATILVLVCSNTAVSLIRNIVSDAVRLPAFVMIIASAVTCIEIAGSRSTSAATVL